MPVASEIRAKLEALLQMPKTKLVLAFEEVRLERLSDYPAWALEIIEQGKDTPEMVKLALLHTDTEPNYFELIDTLRAVVKSYALAPVIQSVAAGLYALGYMESLSSDRQALWADLETLSALGKDWPSVPPLKRFYELRQQLLWYDVNPLSIDYRALESCFPIEAKKFASGASVKVDDINGRLEISVHWGES